MKKDKRETGITLITLIIVISVLIIISAVTIGTINDNKIIDYTQYADDSYTVVKEKEQIGLALTKWKSKYDMSGKKVIFKDEMEKQLKEESSSVEENSDGSLTVEFKQSRNSYVINKDGTMTGPLGDIGGDNSGGVVVPPENPLEDDKTILEKYLFGENRETQILVSILTEDALKYKSNETLGIKEGDISGLTCCISSLVNDIELYIEYKDKKYKYKVSSKDNMTMPNYGLVPIDEWEKNTRVGKYIDIDGSIGIVLYDDDEHGLQVLTQNVVVDKFYLGYDDQTIKNLSAQDKETEAFRLADIDGDKVLNDDNKGLEKAIYSYNRAIETLNRACYSACQQLISNSSVGAYLYNVVLGVRCVGSNPILKDINNGNSKICNSDDFSELAIYPKNNVNQIPGLCNNRGYDRDNNYEKDFDRMAVLGINSSNQDYWVASREIYSLRGIAFCVNIVDSSNGFLENNAIWWVREKVAEGSNSLYNISESPYAGLRPVIILDRNISFPKGTGTKTDPYTF